MAITTAMRTQVAQLYVSLFGRAPESDGLGYWVTQLGNGKTFAQVAQEMYDVAPARAYYPSFLTNEEIVGKFYTNVLGRTADAEGSAYWTAKLNTGSTPGQVISEMITAVAAYSGTDPAGLTSQSLFNNKVTVGLYYAVDLGGNSTTNTVLTGVDSTAASVDAAKAAAATVSGSSYALATTTDNITGTAGNDAISAALVGANATGTTLQAGDLVNGAGGTDTLTIAVSGDNGGGLTTSAVTLQNVEKVLVSNFDTNAATNTFDMSLASGLTTVGLAASSATGDTVFSSVGNVVNGEMDNGSGDLTITYLSTLLTGTTDTQNLTVSNITGGTFTVGNGATGYAETLAITSTGAANTLTLADNHHKTITVAGAKDLTLTMTDTANTTTKVDASAFTGALTLSGLGTTDISIVGGSGNDVITAANIDANDTIDGGTGTDTLKTASALTSTTAAHITNFETLELTAGGLTQSASALSGITTLSVNEADGANTSTFTNATNSMTLAIKAVGNAGDNVTLTNATDTATDSKTVTLGTSTSGVTFGTLTLSDDETITINNALGTSGITSLVSSDATKLVLNADKALTITGVTAASLATLDASASTANVTVGALSAAASITGGAGNDNFTGGGNADTIVGGAGNDTLDGGAGNDSISGGAGDDSITGGTGNDTIDGGDGNDTFVNAALNTESVSGGNGDDTFVITTFASLTSADTLSGGAGNDTLSFAENTDHNFTTDITILSNVSSMEKFSFTGLAGDNDTVTVNDGVVSAAGGTLTLENASASASTWDASNVLSSTSKVVFSSTTAAGASAQTYKIGNGIDQVTMGSAADTVTVTNNAYLSSSDTLDGGTGSDTLKFTNTTGSTITAAQLSHVTSFETFNITTGGAGDYVFTLTDAIVSNEVASGSTFTVTRASGDTGTTKVDASALSSSYAVSVTGGAGADTLIGGAANDTIKGGNGADSLTGGGGNDTFVYAGTETGGPDTITDFSFGTSSTSVDVLKVTHIGANAFSGGGVKLASAGAASSDVIVMDTATYADAAAAETAANGINSDANKSLLIIWQDSLGSVHVTLDGDSDTDAGALGATLVDLAKLSGVTITGVASLIDAGDFTLL